MFGLFLKLLSSAVSFQYPIYASYKALKHENRDLLVPWLVYWVVVSVFTTFETLFGFLFVWLPLYQFFRFGFMLWLVLPQSQGSYYVYSTYIEPTLASHEQEIELLIRSAQDNAKTRGIEMINHVIEYITSAMRSTLFYEKQPLTDSSNSSGPQYEASSDKQPEAHRPELSDYTPVARLIYNKLRNSGSRALNTALQTTTDIAAYTVGSGSLSASAAAATSLIVPAIADSILGGGAVPTYDERTESDNSSPAESVKDAEVIPTTGSYYSRSVAFVSKFRIRRPAPPSVVTAIDATEMANLSEEAEEPDLPTVSAETSTWPGRFVDHVVSSDKAEEAVVAESIDANSNSPAPDAKTVDWVLI